MNNLFIIKITIILTVSDLLNALHTFLLYSNEPVVDYEPKAEEPQLGDHKVNLEITIEETCAYSLIFHETIFSPCNIIEIRTEIFLFLFIYFQLNI